MRETTVVLESQLLKHVSSRSSNKANPEDDRAATFTVLPIDLVIYANQHRSARILWALTVPARGRQITP